MIGPRRKSATTSFGFLRLTLSILTTLVHPAAKKGISLPTFRPTNAAPNGDNTGIWVWSDV